MTRHDNVVPGEPFFVIQYFDREGYYSSCLGPTPDAARDAASKRMLKSITAMSIPFPGSWNGVTPDVSLPPDFKEQLQAVNRSLEDE